MLEFIRFLVDIASKMANVVGQAKQKRLKEIGQGMFLVYFRTTEVVDTGDDIISMLNRIRECIDFRTRNWGEDVKHAASVCTGGTLRSNLFIEQYLNIYRLYGALSRIQNQFKLLDAELEVKLRHLIGHKSSALRWFTERMREGKILLEYPPDVDAFARIFDPITRDENAKDLLEQANKQTVDVTNISDSSFSLIVQYLDSSKPHQDIEEFRATAKKIHNLIEKHWTIQDLLFGMDKIIRETR